MIEELTPQILSVALFLAIALSSALTLPASALVLGLYRRGVARAMAASAGGDSCDLGVPQPCARRGVQRDHHASGEVVTDERYRRALLGPLRAAWHSTIAGGVFALVMSAGLALAFPPFRTPLALLLFAWGYAWPIAIAIVLTVPSVARTAMLACAAYFSPLLIGTLVALGADGPSELSGLDVAALRDAITPYDIVRSWLAGNAFPSILLALFLNRRIRAVGPVLLALITTVSVGCVLGSLGLATREGTELMIRTSVASGVGVPWLLSALLLAVIGTFGALGWHLLRGVRAAYLRKTLNDRSLALDALWLYFAGVYAVFFAMAAVVWVAAPLAAFLAYKATARAILALIPPPPIAPRGLTFLRVFSLGRRSDRLLDELGRYWRHIGSMQLITGPDVAHSTVQPHQLLDFLAGRLATHFIGDTRALEQRIRQSDAAPDHDGSFRINNFFCHADTWQAVLAHLVSNGDVVLMDLRSFSARHAGCVHEVRHLVRFVPLSRCVLLVDDSTDRAFLLETLRDAWRTLPSESPNRDAGPEAVALHHLDSGPHAMRKLLRQLCEAAA